MITITLKGRAMTDFPPEIEILLIVCIYAINKKYKFAALLN